MSPALANFLFEVANFVVLALLLGWLLFKPIRRALDQERDRHAEAEEQATEHRQEAERLAAEARRARERLKSEIDERRAEALREAEQEAARLKAEARRARDEERQARERELEALRSARMIAFSGSLGQVAAESVRRLLETIEGPRLDTALVRAACRELEKLQHGARGGPSELVVVECARPLQDEDRRLLAEVLGVRFRERIVAELGAGVRVTTTAGQVDSSAAAVAREAARQISRAIAPEGGT